MFVYLILGYLLAGMGSVICPAGRSHIRKAGLILHLSSNPFRPPKKHPLWKVITFYSLVCGSAVILWPLFLAQIVKEARKNTHESIREFGRKSRAGQVSKTWLRNRITVEEAESKHMVHFSIKDDARDAERGLNASRPKYADSSSVALTEKAVPFGFMNSIWREMVASIREGDELWEYSNSQHFWQHLAGRAGIALVRKGEIVEAITTVLN